jgi:exo-1,4-beta-D-glucosaminidase
LFVCFCPPLAGRDPFFGTNYSLLSEAQFLGPWVYTTRFSRSWLQTQPASPNNKTIKNTSKTVENTSNANVWLHFRGLSYRANITLNGVLLGNTSTVEGTFRYFAFDITQMVAADNVLVVTVTRPHDECFPPDNNSTDLANSFIDWAPAPLDEGMGLWREVVLELTGPARISAPVVVTTVGPANAISLDIGLRLQNVGGTAVSVLPVTVEVSLPELGITDLSVMVTLSGPGADVTVWLNASQFPALKNIENAQLWVAGSGFPAALYNLTATVFCDNSMSDTLSTRIGLRSLRSQLDSNGHRLFLVLLHSATCLCS